MGTRHTFVSAPCHDESKRKTVEAELKRAQDEGEIRCYAIMEIRYPTDGRFGYFFFAGTTAKEMHSSTPDWIMRQDLGIDVVWISDEFSYGLDPYEAWPKEHHYLNDVKDRYE